jgi:Flp pilus assembly protein TadD
MSRVSSNSKGNPAKYRARKIARAYYWGSALLCLIFAATGCSRSSKPRPVQRIAFLRFENLGADADSDWMGRAFSEILTECLAGEQEIYAIPSNKLHAYERALGPRPVSAPGVSAERDLALASGATRLGYGEYFTAGGRLQARLTVEDVDSGKLREYTAAAQPGGVISAASGLCRQAWGVSRPYSTNQPSAVQAYVAALESSDQTMIDEGLGGAIAADPNFAPPYRLLAQTKAQSQDRAGAVRIIETALGHPLQPAARARLGLMAAELRDDHAARLGALQSLVKLEPSDPDGWRSLAELWNAEHQYAAAAGAYSKALAIEPQDAATLNQMGYAQAYAGDLPAALDTLNRYRALRPSDANADDSLGDVYLLYGRLQDAEQSYMSASAKGPHFEQDGPLFKASVAHLMTGDISGADELAGRYIAARAADNDPAVEYRRAEWSWATGRRTQALTQMETFAKAKAETGPLRELGARAYSELAIWQFLLGDGAAAAHASAKATALAGPASAGIAAVARFLVQPAATTDERARLGGDPNDTVQQYALAYARLARREFGPAANVLERLYASGAGSNAEGLPVLLAWAYLETGRLKQAEELVRLNFIPGSSGTGPFFAFYFPRLFQVRATVAQRTGRTADARTSLELFRKLAGQPPLIWDRAEATSAGSR